MSGVKTLLLEQKAQLSAKLPPLEADRDQQRSALAQTMNEIAAVQQEIFVLHIRKSFRIEGHTDKVKIWVKPMNLQG